jgi:hypothetical protein
LIKRYRVFSIILSLAAESKGKRDFSSVKDDQQKKLLDKGKYIVELES